MPAVRNLGVEEELQIVDGETYRLAFRAPELLSELPEEGYAAELQRSTVETNTGVCDSLDDLGRDIRRLRQQVIKAATNRGLEVAGSGTAPLSHSADLELTASGRYARMQQDYRLLVDQHLVCGLQVHVGVDDRDLAVRLMPRLAPALPTLLALSTSSPFFDGYDTGYASVRTMIWQRWPTAGQPARVSSYAEYRALLDRLIETGTISDVKMAYFDVRPSLHVPTLELRVCDCCPLVDDALLIAGLFRALVEQAAQAEWEGRPVTERPGPIYRAAMWRAARSGLTENLIEGGAEPVARPAAEVVNALVCALRPQLEAAGDWEHIKDLAAATLRRGTSSERQRARYTERGKVVDVVQLLVEETSGRVAPARTRTRWSAGYPASALDEAVHPSGTPFPLYQPVFEALESYDAAAMIRAEARARYHVAQQDMTFGVGGEQQPFPVDLFPRIVAAHEWAVLSAGLTQRARAIEAYLRDAYGRARVCQDGLIDPKVITGTAGWRPEARALPTDVVRAPVVGFDLVRDSIAGWRVLEDNVRVPSGVGYAVALRRAMHAVVPDLRGTQVVRDTAPALDLIGTTLRGCSLRPDPVVVLLSEGADNSGWYEHRLLADEVGLLLAQPSEIELRSGRVHVGGRRVDVVYLRLAHELEALVDRAGRRVGELLLEAARQREVVIVNAPGNGIADDKAMYCYVPEMISYYLGERPLLASVPTYRCADPVERQQVLDRIGDLVTKPVGGYGGSGVLIGPHATRQELIMRRQEILDDPANWVAQEVVALSTLPTMAGGRLEPRHIDLRAFVYLTGPEAGQAELADLALTRVAPAGTMVVNSSRGGGAKDTWILADVGGEDD